jgi:hypothetical protein
MTTVLSLGLTRCKASKAVSCHRELRVAMRLAGKMNQAVKVFKPKIGEASDE